MPHHGVPTKKESSVFMNLPALQTLHKYYTSNPVQDSFIGIWSTCNYNTPPKIQQFEKIFVFHRKNGM